MPSVGHESNGKRGVKYVSVVLQFLIALLLAFIGFTLQGLRADTKNSLEIGQQNQVAIGRIESKMDSKFDDMNARLGRLERSQDQD